MYLDGYVVMLPRWEEALVRFPLYCNAASVRIYDNIAEFY
jgi:hypothetical protein